MGRYVVLDPEGVDSKEWDRCVIRADDKFRREKVSCSGNIGWINVL